VKLALQGGFQVSGFADHDGLPVVGLKRGRFRGTATLGSDIGGRSRIRVRPATCERSRSGARLAQEITD
jgi:hypothetical protein